MNVCRHGYEWSCPDCDPESFYAEKRQQEVRARSIAPPVKLKPCGCTVDNRPCAKACGLDMTGWYCEAEVSQPYRFDFLNEREQMALKLMSEQKGMSEEAVMRQALRMYQLVDTHLTVGDHIVFRKSDGTLDDPFDTGPKPAPYEGK